MESELKAVIDGYAAVCARAAKLFIVLDADLIRFQIDGEEVVVSSPEIDHGVYDDSPSITTEEFRFPVAMLALSDAAFEVALPAWFAERAAKAERARQDERERYAEFSKKLLREFVRISGSIEWKPPTRP